MTPPSITSVRDGVITFPFVSQALVTLNAHKRTAKSANKDWLAKVTPTQVLTREIMKSNSGAKVNEPSSEPKGTVT